MDIKTILQNLGYKPQKRGNYYSMPALYRNGDNPSALSVHYMRGTFVDFVSGYRGNLSGLVKLTLGLDSYEKANSWLKTHEYICGPNVESPIIETTKYFDPSILDKLIKNHEYPLSRNIDEDIVKKCNGGIAISGAMAGRYVFPMYDTNKRIVAFSGRDLTRKHSIRWKILGVKSKAIFPHFAPEAIREKGEVILVESIFDALSLCSAGINRVLCLFGAQLPDTILTKLVGMSPKKVIISLNDDSQASNTGNKNSEIIKDRLSQFFDADKISIILPPRNDWGDCDREEILNSLC